MSRTTTRPARILAITTSEGEYRAKGYRTGLWLGELTHFYDVATDAGHEVVIASVAGGAVPLDPESLSTLVLAQGGTRKRYEDREFMDLLTDTVAVDELDANDFDAVYLTGGHGTMFDFSDPAVSDLVSQFWAQGKIVSAVCHGPAGLLDAVDENGKPLLAGRKVTGFSWTEEKLAHRADAVPFKLSQAIKDRGGKYKKAVRPMVEHVIVDGRLITGQNPTSAKGVGKAVVKKLAKA